MALTEDIEPQLPETKWWLRSRLPTASRQVRWIVCIAIALIFFVAALDNDVYQATSPDTLSWHVVLRKIYSIVAFTLVGASYVWASNASLRSTTLAVALYSAGIEVGQHFTTIIPEAFAWNLFDVACGAIGGALGALIPWVRVR